MQYIQFQPQVANDIDAPSVGAINIFVDANDNSIKIKNSDGEHLPVGGGQIIPTTPNALLQMRDMGTLTPGAIYQVNGASSGSIYEYNYIQEGGVVVYVQALNAISINPKGVGIFLNPRYQYSPYNATQDANTYRVWDNTFRFYYDSANGEFDHNEHFDINDPPAGYMVTQRGGNTVTVTFDDNESRDYITQHLPVTIYGNNTGAQINLTQLINSSSYSIGDRVIWGGNVWENISGNVGYPQYGSQYALNPEDWSLLSPNLGVTHNLVANEIEYDLDHDWIASRKDINGNHMQMSWIFNNQYEAPHSVRNFCWGHKEVYNVKSDCATHPQLINFPNYNDDGFNGYWNALRNIEFKPNARLYVNRWGRATMLQYITLGADSYCPSWEFGNTTLMSYIDVGNGSYFGGIHTYDNDDEYDILYDVNISQTTYFDSLYFYRYSYIENLRIASNCTVYGFYFYPYAEMYNIELATASNMYNITLGESSGIQSIWLDTYSDFAYISTNYNSYIYDIKIGQESYVGDIALNQNCNFGYLDAAQDTYFSNITYDGVSSYMEYIKTGPSTYFYDIGLGEESSIQYLEMDTNVDFENIRINDFSQLSYWKVGNNSQIGNFRLGSNHLFTNFEFGQYSYWWFNGINSTIFTLNKNNVTVGRGFSNGWDHILPAGTNPPWIDPIEETTFISSAQNSTYIIDITGLSGNTYGWYLENGHYEGQVMRFALKNDGGASISPQNIQIWIGNARRSDGIKISNNFNWYPFSQAWQSGNWRSFAQCVWVDGAWNTDNDQWD